MHLPLLNRAFWLLLLFRILGALKCQGFSFGWDSNAWSNPSVGGAAGWHAGHR